MPVTAPARKAVVRPFWRLLRAASAVRTLARTEMFMPMKPVAPDRIAPIRKATVESPPRKTIDQDRDDDADDGDRGILAAEIGAGALLDRGCDLDHALVSGRRAQHLRLVTIPYSTAATPQAIAIKSKFIGGLSPFSRQTEKAGDSARSRKRGAPL